MSAFAASGFSTAAFSAGAFDFGVTQEDEVFYGNKLARLRVVDYDDALFARVRFGEVLAMGFVRDAADDCSAIVSMCWPDVALVLEPYRLIRQKPVALIRSKYEAVA